MVLFLLSAWQTPGVPSWLQVDDKVAHAALYTVLGAALGWGKHHAGASPPHLFVLGMGALYGATDEWHQRFVAGRVPDWADWYADVTGVLLGYGLSLFLLGWLVQRATTLPAGARTDVPE